MNTYYTFIKAIKSLVLILVMFFTSDIMAQSPTVLDKLTSLESYKKLYEANSFDHNNSYFKSNDKGLWNNVPVVDVYFYEDNFMCSNDTSVKNSTSQIVAYLEKTYPNNLTIENDYSEMFYNVATRDFTLEFKVRAKTKAAIDENTKGRMEIKFAKVVDNPIANLSEELKINKDGLTCKLKVECYNVVPTVLLDGIPILGKKKEDKYSSYETVILNKYILNPETPINLSFVLTPGIDDKGNIMPKIPKNSYAKIGVEYVNAKGDLIKKINLFNNEAYVTDTIVDNGRTRYSSYPGTNDYTKKDIRFNHQLEIPVDYKLTGWSNGKDLHKEKKVEERIRQFYTDYAALILSKDIKQITQLLYNSYLEKYTYNYNSTEQKSYHDFDELEYMLENSLKVVTAKETKLHISSNGQLAYLEAIDKTSYLKTVGRSYLDNISFIFYIDKNTNELKIIR
ncbi:hypothetical protein LNQ81_14095 [Myroides sp. M-43]|uniref:hypothetical protein n=1 Tax=Myroides oncorhynchi TaxID=2893756 RepID=UPI001E3744C7|nr:hypothetical protein [Myroides oncorhynchi]MCC9043807.1 hypothetical protein [Myroides oncorhynchi]